MLLEMVATAFCAETLCERHAEVRVSLGFCTPSEFPKIAANQLQQQGWGFSADYGICLCPMHAKKGMSS